MRKFLVRFVLAICLLALVPHSAGAQWVQVSGALGTKTGSICAFAATGNYVFAGTINNLCVFYERMQSCKVAVNPIFSYRSGTFR